jgi:hypothetical protein
MVVQAPVRVGFVNPAMLTSRSRPRLRTGHEAGNGSERVQETAGKSPGKGRKEKMKQPVRAPVGALRRRRGGAESGHGGPADTLGT